MRTLTHVKWSQNRYKTELNQEVLISTKNYNYENNKNCEVFGVKVLINFVEGFVV